ncbi:hypothetical protein [Acinetobacter sp.]|uniref:hypothetical protein n=1 Tax=Acinetobacter sp. TaxID=472 RepID=UPI0038900B61
MTCFPFDNTPIADATEDDFWDLDLNFGGEFLKSFKIVDFNSFWDDICDELGKSPGSIESLDDAKSMLRMARTQVVMNALHKEGLLHGFDRLNTGDREIVDTFIDLLPDAYSYKNLGCKLTTPDNIPESSEVWFSGKCVVIADEDEMDIVKEEFGL